MATHYVPAFTTRAPDGRQMAVCGQFVTPREHASEPTCPSCVRWLDALDSVTITVNPAVDPLRDFSERVYRTALQQIRTHRKDSIRC